ncbi:MAG: GNAT family N-acetyltransferase [Desulfomonilia bacterium]
MAIQEKVAGFTIRKASQEDVSLILSFVRELAEYERLLHEVVASEESLRESLFGERKVAEVIFGDKDGDPVAFAVFFHNYSTFLGQQGIYIEDLFVKPHMRDLGIGRAMFAHIARIALERGCGRLDWWVLDWNEPAIKFYKSLGSVPMSAWTVQRLTGQALEKLADEGQLNHVSK